MLNNERPSYYVRVQMVVLNELFVNSQIPLHNRIRVTQSEIAYKNISFECLNYIVYNGCFLLFSLERVGVGLGWRRVIFFISALL